MTNEDLKETAKVILDTASKGMPDLIQHGPILLVKGEDYENEYLQLFGPGGETTPGGFHRALNVRHARYIALVTQAATRLAYRLLELEEENTALSALSIQVLALQEENDKLKNTVPASEQEMEKCKEFNTRLLEELSHRTTKERYRQMQEKNRQRWRECARLELELSIWKERVSREQELTEQFRARIEKTEEALKFYSNPHTWNCDLQGNPTKEPWETIAGCDQGKTARTTLEEKK